MRKAGIYGLPASDASIDQPHTRVIQRCLDSTTIPDDDYLSSLYFQSIFRKGFNVKDTNKEYFACKYILYIFLKILISLK